jgi:adenine-specific DNA-methyltransferase
MSSKNPLYDITSLNYIGAKKKLLPFLDNLISPKLDAQDTFMDLFAGSGIVSQLFKHRCSQIIANDIEHYSFVINHAFLCSSYTPQITDIIQDINNMFCNNENMIPNPSTDLVYANFSPFSQEKRMYFTIDNALRIDKTRQYIEKMYVTSEISIDDYYFLLASLLVSADKLANTTCVYSAFLKKFKDKARELFVLKPIHTYVYNISSQLLNIVFKEDAHCLMKKIQKEDIKLHIDHIYIDPPYCIRQYGANYGLLNYIVMYDSKNELYGKTGVLREYYKSPYAQKLHAKEAFRELLASLSPQKSIFISYNSEGILHKDDIIEMLRNKGKITLYKKPYRRYASTISKIEDQLYEYLFHVDCQFQNEQAQFDEIVYI